METSSFDQLERLFRAARHLAGVEREAFVNAACGDDHALKQELKSLLDADEGADKDSFLTPVEDVARNVLEQGEQLLGQRIGPYKLIEPLGEGGMGEVWLAEQKEPIKRHVAFKVIKLGMDTKEVVARFESERQALAVMNHPNIAKVYDAGVTESGRPYFVMELVQGVPVNEYCDRYRLSTEDRIKLFIDICRAVQHAHQKGVIHRDLKPSNVLVTEHDDEPVPKVIDFGIAKAVGFNLTTMTLVTSVGQLIGTPAYMSPEQAEFQGMDVDTRTDVYSLGVILYELLVGTKPIDFQDRAQAAIHEAIRDSQVQKPSTRLTSLGNKQQTIAECRQTTPERLKKELKGDLDWIVLKSMEKDRSRRYETVNGLAMELGRYLEREPVIARPPSMAYRLGKFIQRNRTMVGAAALVLLTLVGGITAASIALVRARIAEDKAQQEALTANEVSNFMIELFEVSDPSVARGNSITAREILDQGARRIENELTDQPAVRARLLQTMGMVYWELGLEEESARMLEEAIGLREEIAGPDDLELAQSLRALAEVKGKHFGGILPEQRAEILEILHRALAIHQKQLGPDHPEVGQDWVVISEFMHSRAVREDSIDYDGAIEAAEKALAIWEKAYGEDSPKLAGVLNELADLHSGVKKDFDTASELLRRSVAILEKAYGTETGELLDPLYGLYMIEFRKDYRSPNAFEVFKRLWTISDEAILNSDAYISLFINLGTYLQYTGHPDEAEASLERAARLLEQKFGPDVEDMVFAHFRLVQLYIAYERWEEAEQKALWMKPIWARNDSPFNVANAMYYAGIAQAGLGRFEEAEQSLQQARELFDDDLSRHSDLTVTLWELARVQRLQGKHAVASRTEALTRANALEATIRKGARGADFRFYAFALLGCRELWKIRTSIVECYGEPYDTPLALEYAQKSYEVSPDTRFSPRALGIAHHYAGNQDDAIAMMEEAMSRTHPKDPTALNMEEWLERIKRETVDLSTRSR